MQLHAKVAYGGFGGACTVLLIWFLTFHNIQVPGDVASAMTVVFSVVAGWIAPNHYVDTTLK